MVKKVVSWVLVGAFGYLWWWAAHRWVYLHTEGNVWTSVFELMTLISLVALLRDKGAGGPGMFGTLIVRVRGFLPNLLGLVGAVVVLRVIAIVVGGGAVDVVDNLTHAVVTALAAGITTALWYGAIANAGDS